MIMEMTSVPFDRRLKRIVRYHQRLSYGAKRVVTKSGLIVVRPRIYNPKFLFKAYIYADLGQADYASRVAAISGPSIMEKAGAWIMQADPATVLVGNGLKTLGV
jgi:hypothetical protein